MGFYIPSIFFTNLSSFGFLLICVPFFYKIEIKEAYEEAKEITFHPFLRPFLFGPQNSLFALLKQSDTEVQNTEVTFNK